MSIYFIFIGHKGGENIQKQKISKINNLIMFGMVIIGLFVIFSYCVGNVSAASGDTIYVNASGNDNWDGLNSSYNGTSGPKATIKNAIATLNTDGTIFIANGVYTGVNNTGIAINKNMHIIGESQKSTIINAKYLGRIFTITNGVTVTLQNLTLLNGTINSGTGGAIFNSGTLTINNSTLYNNTATGSYGGGAIYNSGTLTVNNSTFNNNNGGQYSSGGAIYNDGGIANVTNDIFTGNTATLGGAIANIGTLTVTNDTFTNNNAGDGGAIYNGNTLTVNNSTFTENTAFYGGGAIYNDGTLTVNNSTFTENTAFYGGGAIYNDGTLTVNNSTLNNNTATNGEGGAIYNEGIAYINFNWIFGNTASVGTQISNEFGIINAEDNWWGSNNPDFNTLFYGMTGRAYSNWIILTVNANPNTINNNGTSIITADFNHTNGGFNLIGGYIPDGIPITFTSAWGNFTQSSITTINGQVTTIFQATGTSTPNTNPIQIYANADSENTNTPIYVIIQTNITANPVKNVAGQSVTLKATVKDAYGTLVNKGYVTFNVSYAGTSVNAGTAPVDSNGVATLTTWSIPSNWNMGTYNITTNYDGTNTNYTNSTNKTTLTIDPIPISLTIDPANGYKNHDTILTAKLWDTFNNKAVNDKTINFYINGISQGTGTTNNQGIATFTYNIIQDVGTYTNIIGTTFTADNQYTSAKNNNTLIVNPLPTNLTVDPVNNCAGQKINLKAHLTDYYGNPVNEGQIEFTINGKTVNAPVLNGIASIYWTIPSNWNTNTYKIQSTYQGTNNYLTSTNTSILTVDLTPTNITVDLTHNFSGQNITLVAKVNDIYNQPVNDGKVNFIIDGLDTGLANVSNGIATLNWIIPTSWNAGNYIIITAFEGTGTNYNNSTNSSILKVDPSPTNVTVGDVSGLDHQTVTIYAVLIDTYGNPLAGQKVIFSVNGHNYSAITNNNGIGTINYIPNGVGNYNVTVNYIGNNNYTASEGMGVLSVNPSAYLYLQITSSNKNLKVGYQFTVTYKLGNKGPDNATNVTITIPLPSGFTVSNITGDGNWTYQPTTNAITWTLTNVTVGDPYLYITGKTNNSGTYVFGSNITSETYNLNNESVNPISITSTDPTNPTTPKTILNTATNTIPMQHTGLPFTGLILAILTVLGGSFMSRKK